MFDVIDLELAAEITARAMKMHAKDEEARTNVIIEATKAEIKALGAMVRALGSLR